MKTSRGFLLFFGAALVFLAGIGFHKTVAQQQKSDNAWVAEQVNLPPDIHPETLSRATRIKREDFTTDEERQAYDRVMGLMPKQSVARWLGPTGTRLRIPEVAEIDHTQLTFKFQGRYHRLTDVHGKVVKELLA